MSPCAKVAAYVYILNTREKHSNFALSGHYYWPGGGDHGLYLG